MLASNLKQRKSARWRFFFSLLASTALNIVLLATYPRLALDRDVREQTIPAPVIHIEHRRIPRRHPLTPRRPKPRPVVAVAAVPRQIVIHKRIAQKPKTVVALIPKKHHRETSALAGRQPSTQVEYSNTSSFTHQAARLKLPPNWSTENLANGAAADTTLWLDFKKARGATVPRVFLLHLKTTYMSGPTIEDAIHDIVQNLRGDGARVYVSKAQRICSGKRPGWYLSYEKPSEDPPMQFEDRLFVQGDTVYMATYSRPDGQAEDAKTRAALDTLCPLT